MDETVILCRQMLNESPLCSHLHHHQSGVDGTLAQVRPVQLTLPSLFKLNSFKPRQFKHSTIRRERGLACAARRFVGALIRSTYAEPHHSTQVLMQILLQVMHLNGQIYTKIVNMPNKRSRLCL